MSRLAVAFASLPMILAAPMATAQPGAERTVRRLETKDPSMKKLVLCRPHDWDFEHWRRTFFVDDGPRRGHVPFVDSDAWLESLVQLLRLAQGSLYVDELEFVNIPMYHPAIQDAAVELLQCDARVWKEWTIDNCSGLTSTFLTRSLIDEKSCALASLQLVENDLSAECVFQLGRLLQDHESLVNLRLSDRLSGQGLVGLASGLAQNQTLKTLNLQECTFLDNPLIDPGDDESPPPMVALAGGVGANTCLERLSLNQCQLYDDQLVILLRSLHAHPSLSWLDLSHNCCGPESCAELGSKLEQNDGRLGRGWESLILNSCQISDWNVMPILTGLESCPHGSLQSLHLDENYLFDDGIHRLANAARRQTKLKSLSISHNMFGNGAALALLDAVKTNCDLEEVIVAPHLQSCKEIRYYTLLNRGGRKLLLSDQRTVPIGLWPFLLDRARRISHTTEGAGAHDIIFYMLQGPALWHMTQPNV